VCTLTAELLLAGLIGQCDGFAVGDIGLQVELWGVMEASGLGPLSPSLCFDSVACTNRSTRNVLERDPSIALPSQQQAAATGRIHKPR
jgi:hypothetical protein